MKVDLDVADSSAPRPRCHFHEPHSKQKLAHCRAANCRNDSSRGDWTCGVDGRAGMLSGSIAAALLWPCTAQRRVGARTSTRLVFVWRKSRKGKTNVKPRRGAAALRSSKTAYLLGKVVRPGGLELPTFWFVARRSIQLSYGRTRTSFTINSLPLFLLQFQPRVSMHSHPINSKRLSKNSLHIRASSAAARRSI